MNPAGCSVEMSFLSPINLILVKTRQTWTTRWHTVIHLKGHDAQGSRGRGVFKSFLFLFILLIIVKIWKITIMLLRRIITLSAKSITVVSPLETGYRWHRWSEHRRAADCTNTVFYQLMNCLFLMSQVCVHVSLVSAGGQGVSVTNTLTTRCLLATFISVYVNPRVWPPAQHVLLGIDSLLPGLSRVHPHCSFESVFFYNGGEQ